MIDIGARPNVENGNVPQPAHATIPARQGPELQTAPTLYDEEWRLQLELQTKVHPKVRNHGEGPY